MFKIITKYLIVILFSIFLINSNSYAFHSEGNSEKYIPKTDETKIKDIRSQYCTQQVEESFKTPDIKKPPKKNSEKKQTSKERLDEIDKEKSEEILNETKKEAIFVVSSHHAAKFQDAPKELNFSILKNPINKAMFIGEISSIETLLNYYCVQEKPAENKPKIFKNNNKIKKLYDNIAVINGYEDRKSKIEGDIFDTGIIFLSIEGIELIYSKAKFILDEEKRLNEIAEQKVAERKAKEKADKKAKEERDWIAENKPPLIKKIKSKIKEFDDKITKYNNAVNDLRISHENFSKEFNEKSNEIEDLLDLVDVGQKAIKDKAIELKKAKREFLNENIVKDINSKFKKIKKKEGKNFKIYKKVKVLYDEVEESGKQKHFEKGYRSKFLTKKMPGFFDQWDRVKSRDLDIDKFFEHINDLNSDIDKARNNIENQIDTLKTEIQTLEEELADKLPITEIVIGVIIFLVICIGGYFIFDSSQKRKKEREDAENKIASLKDDLEGKLKDTSEQIKSVSRTAARSQQTPLENDAPEPIQEQPKTPEEIIAEKYDNLVSDYKEALEDFSKVSGFKQKWHGLALSRKERQDGTKTILINSTRPFEKAEIWCVTFSEKYFAFPGSTVKSNMATYMNLDFEKAGRDFKGVFAVSSGSSYLTEPSVLRRGGAGFVVERIGKIIFPN